MYSNLMPMKKNMTHPALQGSWPSVILFLASFLMASHAWMSAQIPAFPGAEGFGAMTTGGRGGRVIEVTNLNDSGTGSLRSAIQSSGSRTVVFRISGTIELHSELRISSDNITIAGQTAPGDGICVRNYPLIIAANNVIIRFIRSRLGDVSNTEADAMSGRHFRNIIIDHCSMSWSVDECGSFYDNENFTLQYCLLSESLYASVHDKGNHGYGGIWGGRGATFHHNLLAHHTSRNPRFCGSRYSNLADQELVDHRNNVIYNWGFNSCYGAEGGNYNMVNNYYKSGPATSPSIRDRIIHPDPDDGSNAQEPGIRGYFYVSDNYIYGFPATTEDNWQGVDGISSEIKDEIMLLDPVAAPAITEQPAVEAFEHVMAKAGAILPARDAIDTRIIHETLTRTAQYGGAYGPEKGIIDSQETVGGWITLESTTPPDDSDHDGMPDAWEDQMGLDKNDPADRNGDLNGNGYTNLEDYLNGLVDAYAYILRPVHFRVDTIVDFAVTLSWDDISDNETGFVIERMEGDTWSELATVISGDTSYTDNSLSANGEYYYRIKAVNDSLESFYTDSVTVSLTVGLEKSLTGLVALRIYPNPMSHQATLRYSVREPSEVVVSLIDLTGREILVLDRGNRNAGEYCVSIRADQLESGAYLVRFRANNALLMRKILITQ